MAWFLAVAGIVVSGLLFWFFHTEKYSGKMPSWLVETLFWVGFVGMIAGFGGIFALLIVHSNQGLPQHNEQIRDYLQSRPVRAAREET